MRQKVTPYNHLLFSQQLPIDAADQGSDGTEDCTELGTSLVNATHQAMDRRHWRNTVYNMDYTGARLQRRQGIKSSQVRFIVQLISALMPPLGSSTVVCLRQCCSVSFVIFLLFFHTLLHRLVVDPLQYSSSVFCSVVLLTFSRLDSTGVHSTLLVSLLSFIRNTCLSHFNRIYLILLDISTCYMLYPT